MSKHGVEEMVADELTESEIVAATLSGKLIEDYPEAFPHPACLVLGVLENKKPVHAVWAHEDRSGYSVLITTYRPDPARWSMDFQKRADR